MRVARRRGKLFIDTAAGIGR